MDKLQRSRTLFFLGNILVNSACKYFKCSTILIIKHLAKLVGKMNKIPEFRRISVGSWPRRVTQFSSKIGLLSLNNEWKKCVGVVREQKCPLRRVLFLPENFGTIGVFWEQPRGFPEKKTYKDSVKIALENFRHKCLKGLYF